MDSLRLSDLPPIVQAAQSPDTISAARRYAALGFSVLPMRGKRPALSSWKTYQSQAASLAAIAAWAAAGRFHNVGLVCGAVAKACGLVILDLDGRAAYLAFASRFPHLAATFTITTGSGRGQHVYLLVEQTPRPNRALNTPLGNVELRSSGQLVVAAPSTHPQSGRPYTVMRPLDLLRVPDVDDVARWIVQLKRELSQVSRRKTTRPASQGEPTLNPALVAAIAAHLRRAGYRQNGVWLNGTCIYPQRHAHDDKNPSFGFNVETGYGNCFVCGSMLAKDIAPWLGIELADH